MAFFTALREAPLADVQALVKEGAQVNEADEVSFLFMKANLHSISL
jgi:hypothetical protein